VTAEKSLLEVAPPTLQMVLLIYGFYFRSAFPPHCRIFFPVSFFHVHLAEKGTFPSVIFNFDLQY